MSDGVSGYLYEVNAEENQVIPFKNIPCARLATTPMPVANCVHIENAYNLFMDYVAQGKIRIGHFHEKTEQQLAWWYSGLVDYLKEKDMIQIPDCSYARFIQDKFPQLWEKYVSECY